MQLHVLAIVQGQTLDEQSSEVSALIKVWHYSILLWVAAA